jgi:hypothetical protein
MSTFSWALTCAADCLSSYREVRDVDQSITAPGSGQFDFRMDLGQGLHPGSTPGIQRCDSN